MSRRRDAGRRCAVIWWGDIPTQVLVRDDRQTLKASLPTRFQHAIDRRRDGRRTGRLRRLPRRAGPAPSRPCSEDLQAELDAEVAELDRRFPDAELDRIIRSVRGARLAARGPDQHPEGGAP